LVGLLIVIVGIITFRYFAHNLSHETPEVKLVRDIALECASLTLHDALTFLGSQGGFYSPPEGKYILVESAAIMFSLPSRASSLALDITICFLVISDGFSNPAAATNSKKL